MTLPHHCRRRRGVGQGWEQEEEDILNPITVLSRFRDHRYSDQRPLESTSSPTRRDPLSPSLQHPLCRHLAQPHETSTSSCARTTIGVPQGATSERGGAPRLTRPPAELLWAQTRTSGRRTRRGRRGREGESGEGSSVETRCNAQTVHAFSFPLCEATQSFAAPARCA